MNPHHQFELAELAAPGELLPDLQSGARLATTSLAAIALGSNLGDSVAILRAAVAALANHPAVEVQAVSRWYQTPAVGPPQPDYLNGCAVLAVRLDPEGLLQHLLKVEQQFGRQRRERWGPRTLDLDLLLYDQQVLTTPDLELPHPRLRERAFVLVPLAEIAPDWAEPVSGLTIRALTMAVDCRGIRPLSSGCLSSEGLQPTSTPGSST